MAHEHPPEAMDASQAGSMSSDAKTLRPDVGPAPSETEEERVGGTHRTERTRVADKRDPDLLATASHDLRNELNGMVSFAKLIELELARTETSERVLGYARRIEHAGARMSRLIGDLVDLTRIECGDLRLAREKDDAVQVLIDTTETFQSEATERGIELDVELGVPAIVLELDRVRVTRVIGHLIEIAFDATPHGTGIVARVDLDGDVARFAVAAPAARDAHGRIAALFGREDRTVETDCPSAGLAACVCRAIVEAHGGELHVEDVPAAAGNTGSGTAIVFTLPRS